MNIIEQFQSICENKHVIGANIVITDTSNILAKASFGYANKEDNELSEVIQFIELLLYLKQLELLV